MNPLKVKLLEEILSHLSDSQAGDLKSLLDESKKPKMPEESPEEEALESPKEELAEDGKLESSEVSSSDPKSVIPGEDEMTDEELKELIAKHLS